MYDFTDHIEEDLRALVVLARTHCAVRSDLFINHAEFYPALDPAYAQQLVPLYTKAAMDAGTEVHNGASWLGQIKLRDTMHFAAESTREVVEMYISAVRLMVEGLPPPQQKTDESESMCTGSDYSAHPEEEAESEDPEKGPEEDPEEDQESAEAVRQQLLLMFEQWNENNKVQKPVPECLLQEGQVLLPTRMPARLSAPDNRFHKSKKARVFVCDECGQEVRFSSVHRNTGYRRADCEFAGSFHCNKWHDLPAFLRREAWEQRFIDATWYCAHICGAKTTLNEEQKQRRQERTTHWQSTQPSSSSGKGGKAGKGKRSWEGMPGAKSKSKGLKTGGSKGQEQARWQRRS